MLARVLGDGESPAWWGVPVGRVAGCEIRVHLITLVFVGAALAYSVWNGPAAPFVGSGLAALALAVLLREAVRGHAMVRWAGLRPGAVTLWPLGAVWDVGDRGAGGGRRAAGGEAVGAAVAWLGAAGVCAAGACILGLGLKDWSLLRPDPGNPGLSSGSTVATLGRLFAWNVYAAGGVLVVANLLPMLPLDGGVVLRALADRRPGSTTAARVGLITATVLVGGGLVTGLHAVTAVGVCGGVVCWHAWQTGRFVVDPAGVDRWREFLAGEETGEDAGPIPGEITGVEREGVERILEKISRRGMGSLTRAERGELQRATERLRRGSGPG